MSSGLTEKVEIKQEEIDNVSRVIKTKKESKEIVTNKYYYKKDEECL